MRSTSSRDQLTTVASLVTYMTLCLTLIAVASPSLAADSQSASHSPKWIFPVIADFGGVHPRPDLPVRPDPKVNYKIFVDIVSDSTNSKGQYHGLIRLARLVNLMAYAGVPPKHVHIAALLDGKNGFASLDNAAFQKRFKKDNPNSAIIHSLKKAGVEIMVCSQALAGLNVPDEAIDKSVTITLSALTDAVVYGQKGYIYMQL